MTLRDLFEIAADAFEERGPEARDEILREAGDAACWYPIIGPLRGRERPSPQIGRGVDLLDHLEVDRREARGLLAPADQGELHERVGGEGHDQRYAADLGHFLPPGIFPKGARDNSEPGDKTAPDSRKGTLA